MDTTAPIIQQHELTSRCNNACAFCYNPERSITAFTPRSGDRELNLRVAQTSVERGVMAVCPTGGEPLLVGDHLFEILDIYHQAGCYTSLNSNGRLVTPEVGKRLVISGLNSALISLHGLGELHDQMVGVSGAFGETWRGLNLFREFGIAVTPNFVATAKNLHGLESVGQRLIEAGFKTMTVTPFLPSWGSKSHEMFLLERDHYRLYFQSIRNLRRQGLRIDSTLPIPPCVLIRYFPENWMEFLEVVSPRVCMAGRSFGVVSPDGQFRACIQAPYLSKFGGSVLENYRESWLAANKWAASELLPDECWQENSCAALAVCGGGCRTSCLWENQGKAKGRTMYMGEPLSLEIAKPFLDRARFEIEYEAGKTFQLRPQIRVRNEGWGLIVFNPALQSFAVLSAEAEKFLIPGRKLNISSPKLAKVLLAIQAIESSEDKLGLDQAIPEPKVLPGKIFLPRLARGLEDQTAVYCLRADTGERYFF